MQHFGKMFHPLTQTNNLLITVNRWIWLLTVVSFLQNITNLITARWTLWYTAFLAKNSSASSSKWAETKTFIFVFEFIFVFLSYYAQPSAEKISQFNQNWGNCVMRAALQLLRSWVALSFKVVNELGIANPRPNLHFFHPTPRIALSVGSLVGSSQNLPHHRYMHHTYMHASGSGTRIIDVLCVHHTSYS